MLFRSKHYGRAQQAPPRFQPEKPIRLDEARLALWARALGQRREAFRPALGESGAKPYVWLVEAESASSRDDVP